VIQGVAFFWLVVLDKITDDKITDDVTKHQY
jgi:hypothetical protein